LLWLPSQRTPFDDCLQPQKHTRLVSSAVYFFGTKSVSLCEPSQNGWLADLPQAHQKYDFPASTSTGNGAFWAMIGVSDMGVFLFVV
jgi:hypothetical protein